MRAIVEALEDAVVTSPSEVSAYHALLRADADRLGELVADLFELNRINAGQVELEVERTRLADVVTDVVTAFGVSADARGVALRVRPLSVDPEVDASIRHLERALGNLLDNALRYSHAGGLVEVEILPGSEHATVAIDDSCGSTDLGELEALLVDGDEAASSNGRRGLGLAIAKGLVQAHGGELGVARRSGGCRFTVSLPLANGRLSPRARSEVSRPGR
jgi:signal transduction histidine kinase